MQRLLLKRINRTLQRNHFQATELTFNPLLGLHPASDFGEQQVREMRFFNVLKACSRKRNFSAELSYHGRRRSISGLMSMVPGTVVNWDERAQLPAFGMGLAPSPDQFRHSQRPILRRTAFLRSVYPPQALLRTLGERQLRPRSNHRLLQLPPKLANRPKKWLSR